MDLPLPEVGVSSTLLPFAVVAIAMIAVTVFVLLKILPRGRGPPLLTQIVLALSVLFGGSVLLLALLFVFLDPNGTTAWTWVLLAFNFMMMFPVGFWFVSLILFEDRAIGVRGWGWPLALAVATTGSEVLMGLLFAVGGAGGTLGLAGAFALGLSSIWLYWSMAVVMVALVLWSPLSPIERSGSVALVASAAVAPWITAFPLVGGAAAAAVMVGLFLYLARVLLAGRTLPGEIRFVAALSGLLLAMALAAIALVATGGSSAARIGFGAVMVAGMIGEVAYLVLRCYRGALRPSEDGTELRSTAVPPLRAGDAAFDAAAADSATVAP
ncbi:MAG TPA: hypothetical protein VML53_04830 [Thermoplasmata archaeon]|nr:hypothetical protein [Thermoplasmata archaeon]